MFAYLSPASFNHELPGKVGSRLRLQRPDHDGLVQWVTRDNLTERKGGREGEREGGREGREGWKEGGREGDREGEREGGG